MRKRVCRYQLCATFRRRLRCWRNIKQPLSVLLYNLYYADTSRHVTSKSENFYK